MLHKFYLNPSYSDPHIPEHERIAFTRIRLSSHDLSFEKGRWSRIAPNDRLCPCGEIQTDHHVLLQCRLTQVIREEYDIENDNLNELFTVLVPKTICKYCAKVLIVYDKKLTC